MPLHLHKMDIIYVDQIQPNQIDKHHYIYIFINGRNSYCVARSKNCFLAPSGGGRRCPVALWGR